MRHKPESIGLQLNEYGWADVTQLINNLNEAGKNINFGILKEIVETDNKNRFSFDDSFKRIRANQGHSIKINLGYKPQQPPDILYHGTATRFVDSIHENGLIKQNRHHVHLSLDIEIATNVGKRHGKPFVFEVDTKQMHEDNHLFFISENGVWLTDYVPVKYLKPVTLS